MYYVYVLRSEKDGSWYTGFTKDLKRRIWEHNNKRDKKNYTFHKRPWRLIYREKFLTRSKAMKQEKFFKTGKGRKYLQEKNL